MAKGKYDMLFDLVMKSFDVFGAIIMVRNYLFNHDYYTVIKRSKELVRPENSKKKLYICALGPSLKDVDLSKIDGDSIVVNRFFKMKEHFPNFVPTYYTMVDGHFSDPDKLADFKAAFDTYYDKGTIFILSSAFSRMELLKKYSPKQVYYISGFSGQVHPKKNYRIDKINPITQNVVGSAILNGVQMGYKEIYLLGCDFNSFASLTRNHSYKDASSERLYTMHEELFAYSIAAKIHEELEEYAHYNGVKVYNATRASLIDAYERIELDWA